MIFVISCYFYLFWIVATSPGCIETWPNPAGDRISLYILNKGENPLELKWVDLAGRVVYQERIPAVDANFIRDLSLSEYSGGVYFISLSSNGYTVMQKIIKQ